MDPACHYPYLYPLLGTDFFSVARPPRVFRRRKQPFPLAVYPQPTTPPVDRTDCQLPDLCHYRLHPDRVEQPVRHHPHAGLHADSYLLSACHRLSGNASVICGRYRLSRFSFLGLFPIQELPTGTGSRLPVLFLPLYRSGKPSFSTAHLPFGTLDIRSLPFPVTQIP